MQQIKKLTSADQKNGKNRIKQGEGSLKHVRIQKTHEDRVTKLRTAPAPHEPLTKTDGRKVGRLSEEVNRLRLLLHE